MTAPADLPGPRVLVPRRALEDVAHNLTDTALRLEERQAVDMAALVQNESRTIRQLLLVAAEVPGEQDPVAFLRARHADMLRLVELLHSTRPELKSVSGVALALGFLRGAVSNLDDELRGVKADD